ncbi:hypothetical protein ACJX0J_012850, partial [Zea mays]
PNNNQLHEKITEKHELFECLWRSTQPQVHVVSHISPTTFVGFIFLCFLEFGFFTHVFLAIFLGIEFAIDLYIGIGALPIL